MNRETILKKERILSRIPYKEYRELLSFVEDFYLADYSLKILVARKGSNLFSALIDLVREEDGGRVRNLYQEKFEGKEPVIISNRALDYYAQGIKDGAYKNVLICDDTLRHGKVISRLSEKVHRLLPEGKPDLLVFAACKEDGEPNLGNIGNRMIKRSSVKLGEYRKISDMVIDTLSLAAQPYTSYIPNIALRKESPLYQLFANRISAKPESYMEETEEKKLKLRASIWCDPEAPKFSMFQGIRIYLYGDLEQCALVPMVLPMPISKDTLAKYGEILKNLIEPSYYEKVFSDCSELSYRTVIYVMSSLLLRQYIRKELCYEGVLANLENLKEEKLNFGAQALNQERINQMSLADITRIWVELNADYKAVGLEEIKNLEPDIKELLHEVEEKMSVDFQEWTDIDALIKKLFAVCGEWSDESWRNKSEQECAESENLYPVLCLVEKLNMEKNKKLSIYKHILQATDYGRGAILAKEIGKNETTCYLPFLVSGERSYKYRQERYFPALYGLLEMERKAAVRKVDLQRKKDEFLKNKLFEEKYSEAELRELGETNVTADYKSVLLRDVWHYPDQAELDQSIRLASQIMLREDTTDYVCT